MGQGFGGGEVTGEGERSAGVTGDLGKKTEEESTPLVIRPQTPCQSPSVT